MKKTLIIIIACIAAVSASAQTYVSDTKYDWSQVAEAITRGKTTKYDQAYAIYRWLCDNIAYDTTYSIYDSDTAYENRRGVCQAYSELFYRIAEPLGLKVDIISGKSKDRDGKISDMGHAWVFVYTGDNSGILIDPTWGAGGVNNGIFTHTPGDDSWFHVDPHWMIFTHFPDNSTYQLLDNKIEFSTFASMPSLHPELAFFGYKGPDMFAKAIAGNTPELPKCHKPDCLTGIRMPLDGTLRVGEEYEFAVKAGKPCHYVIINGKEYHKDWSASGDVAATRFVPSTGGRLVLAYSDKPDNDTWSHIVEYKVAQPTAADISRLEAKAPHKSPALTTLPGYNYDLYKKCGVDFGKLLSEVKAKGITMLPEIYSAGDFHVGNMTMNGKLKPGSNLTFRFSPYADGEWVIINGEDWQQDWSQDSQTREWVMNVTVAPAGSLILAYKPTGDSGNRYTYCMKYEIGD